jgi:hypothetical protein
MDPNPSPNQADKHSPPREADDLSPLGESDELHSPAKTDEVSHEPDQTTLGNWLEGFLRQPSPPGPPSAAGPLSRNAQSGRRSSSPPVPLSSSAVTEPRDLADAVSDAWPLTPSYPLPVTRGPSPDSSPRHRRSPLNRIRRKIRRLLRNRLTQADLARILATAFLLLAGTVLIVATALRYVTLVSPRGGARAPWQIPLLLVANALVWIVGLAVPSLVMIKLIEDLPWFRVALYFSVIWFLVGLALFM